MFAFHKNANRYEINHRGFISMQALARESLLLARKGIGYGHDAGEERHNNTADVGVLCSAVNKVGDQSCERKDDYYREEPDTDDTCDRIKDESSCDVELSVLTDNHNCRTKRRKEHLPAETAAITLLASYCVVIAVTCNADGNVIHKPERKVKEDIRKVAEAECADGCEAPESIVGKKERVGDEYKSEGRYYNYYRKEDCTPPFALTELNAAFFLINDVNLMRSGFFILLRFCGLIALSHNGDCANTAEETPYAYYAGCALKLDAKHWSKHH